MKTYFLLKTVVKVPGNHTNESSHEDQQLLSSRVHQGKEKMGKRKITTPLTHTNRRTNETLCLDKNRLQFCESGFKCDTDNPMCRRP